MIFYLKSIKFLNFPYKIISQFNNGPCPLIAIFNVLILQNKILLTNNEISLEEILKLEIFNKNLKLLLPTLIDGLNVDLFFNNCLIKHDLFNELQITLCHGWIVDIQDSLLFDLILKYDCSYDKITELAMNLQENNLIESELAKQFIINTSSQLTTQGIILLNETLSNNSISILFRNNHFSTLYKRNGELFILVTDHGFLNEKNVIWETLQNINGDCTFVDENFNNYKPNLEHELTTDSTYDSEYFY